MRLFIAVNFDDPVKRRLLEAQAEIRAKSLRGNFSREENLHLTLVFLGECPGEGLPEIRRLMGQIAGPPPELSFSGLGCFSRARKELWYLEAEEGPGLERLREIQQELSSGLRALGLPIDTRPFRAHITLGREIRRKILWDSRSPERPEWNGRIGVPVKRISLMKSEHTRGLLVYTGLFGQDL
ncbi:MAG: RNA 2',3'-cyclic phosphodiesterase [Treponema sp.]|jgi:2'-5' RNA ligase|nr:RNA 2',3'-cyclic phosphodiesterase [Treponema sp.]